MNANGRRFEVRGEVAGLKRQSQRVSVRPLSSEVAPVVSECSSKINAIKHGYSYSFRHAS